jgi:hypothetical protein
VKTANTIIAKNSATSKGPDVLGVFASQGFNLIGNAKGSSGWRKTDRKGTAARPIDPKLDALKDNGGPTQTMALLPGSPAINKGRNALAIDATEAALQTDQRGFPRRVGQVDIGAFEL